MSSKRIKTSIPILLVLLLAMTLTACGIVPVILGGISPTPDTGAGKPGENLVQVSSPEAARLAVVAFIQLNYGSYAPANNLIWLGSEVPSSGLVGSSSVQYVAHQWVMDIQFPIVAPDATIYTVKLRGESGFSWEGLVDAYGRVVTTAVTFGAPTATATVVEPEPTLEPTATATPTETPTLTPTPKPTQSPTPIPVPCNAAKFVKDVTIPDGTTFAPITDFNKTWRIQNNGTCTWTKDYDLVFVDGNRMEGPKAVALPGNVRPGESVDLSVTLTSPATAGDHRGFWMLRADDGEIFGIGSNAQKAFWVTINVIKAVGSYQYDFALNYCAATWRSDAGRLSCSEPTTSEDGFVNLDKNPELETRQENELALWVHPNEVKGGWIEGTYPFVEIEAGDHFLTWVGCVSGYNKCSLKFYLDYQDENGKIRRLGEWLEVQDNMVKQVDIDLSSLAGESVRFILGVEANTNNADAAHGYWFVPRIDD